MEGYVVEVFYPTRTNLVKDVIVKLFIKNRGYHYIKFNSNFTIYPFDSVVCSDKDIKLVRRGSIVFLLEKRGSIYYLDGTLRG